MFVLYINRAFPVLVDSYQHHGLHGTKFFTCVKKKTFYERLGLKVWPCVERSSSHSLHVLLVTY